MQLMNPLKVCDQPSCFVWDLREDQVKKRKVSYLWSNRLSETPPGESYAVKEVTEGAEYEFRVSAINESGAGDLSPPSAMVCAKNPNSKFTLRSLHLGKSMTRSKLIFHFVLCFLASSETLFQRPRGLHCCQSGKLCASQNLLRGMNTLAAAFALNMSCHPNRAAGGEGLAHN